MPGTPTPPSLHRELILAFAFVFAGALLVALAGVILLLPQFETPAQAVAYVILLLAADIAIFAWFGRTLLRNRVLRPLERMIGGVEGIATGDYGVRLPEGGSAEMRRLSQSVTHMKERLVGHQEELAANIRSLEETNRQLTEARDDLVRAEKMASVGRLSAGIAHELGNPLSALQGFLEITTRKLDALWPAASEELAQVRGEPDDDLPPEVRVLWLLRNARHETARIDRIVRGLLDYARTREVRPRPIDVNAVVRSTLDLLATQGRLKEVDVSQAVDGPLPAVIADAFQLEQVLVNLVVNAADALEERSDGRIRIVTGERTFKPRVYMPAKRRDDPPGIDYSHRRRFHRPARVPRENPFEPGSRLVEITVEDNGPGIPTELLGQIFEPFVTTKEPGKGTGLGLAVSAGLIDAMGGTIQASNAETGGARFTILLPAIDEAPEAHE